MGQGCGVIPHDTSTWDRGEVLSLITPRRGTEARCYPSSHLDVGQRRGAIPHHTSTWDRGEVLSLITPRRGREARCYTSSHLDVRQRRGAIPHHIATWVRGVVLSLITPLQTLSGARVAKTRLIQIILAIVAESKTKLSAGGRGALC